MSGIFNHAIKHWGLILVPLYVWTSPIVPVVKKSENAGRRNGRKRGGEQGLGPKKRVGVGGEREEEKESKRSEGRYWQQKEEGSGRKRRMNTNTVSEKIRNGMGTPHTAKAWGSCLYVHTRVSMCTQSPSCSSVTLQRAQCGWGEWTHNGFSRVLWCHVLALALCSHSPRNNPIK